MPPSPTHMPAVPDTPPLPTTVPAAPETQDLDARAQAELAAQVTPAETSGPVVDGDAAPAPTELASAECAARLAELFPALFAAIPNTPPRPIKLRIQADIQQRAPGQFTRRSLSPFLHRHTTSTAYLKALVASPHRFDLDGAPAGEVNDEHRQAAVAELQRRRMLHEARRAEQRQAQRAKSRPAAGAGHDPAAAPEAPPGHMASATPPRREVPPRGHARDGPRRRPDRADRPPRPARAARGPGRAPPVQPTLESPGGQEPPRDKSAAPQVTLPSADDSGRRERALLLRAFETSTLSRANFCVLKRIDPSTLDALLAQARSEGASSQPGGTVREAVHQAPPRRTAR